MKRKWILWISLLLIGTLLLTACGKKEEATTGRKNTLIEVENKNGIRGKAIWLGEDDELIVPSDLVDDGGEVKVRFPDGTVSKGTVRSNNPDSNVALLKVDDKSAIKNSGVQPVRVNANTGNNGTTQGGSLYILHEVNGQEQKSPATFIERGNKNGTDYILAEYTGSKAGLKGCPVYDASGGFVGTVAHTADNSNRIVIMPAGSLSQEVDNQRNNPTVVRRDPGQPANNNYSRVVTDEPATTARSVDNSTRVQPVTQPATRPTTQPTTKAEQPQDNPPETMPSVEPVTRNDQEEVTEPAQASASVEYTPKDVGDNSQYRGEAYDLMARRLAENKAPNKSIDNMENAPYPVALIDLSGDKLEEMIYYESVGVVGASASAPEGTEPVEDFYVNRRVVTYNVETKALEDFSYPEKSFDTTQSLPQNNDAIVTLEKDPGVVYNVVDTPEENKYEVKATEITEGVEAASGTVDTNPDDGSASASVETVNASIPQIAETSEGSQEETPAVPEPESEAPQPAEPESPAQEQPAEGENSQEETAEGTAGLEVPADSPAVATIEDNMITAVAVVSPDVPAPEEGNSVYYENRKDDSANNAGMSYDDAMAKFEETLGYSVEEEINGKDPWTEVQEDPIFLNFLQALDQDHGLDILSSGYDQAQPADQKRVLSALVGQRGAVASAGLLPPGRQLSYLDPDGPVIMLSGEETVSWAAQNVFQIDPAGYEQFRAECSTYGNRISPVFYEGVNGYLNGVYYTGSFVNRSIGDSVTLAGAAKTDDLYQISFDYTSGGSTTRWKAELAVREDDDGSRYIALYRIIPE